MRVNSPSLAPTSRPSSRVRGQRRKTPRWVHMRRRRTPTRDIVAEAQLELQTSARFDLHGLPDALVAIALPDEAANEGAEVVAAGGGYERLSGPALERLRRREQMRVACQPPW